MQLLEKFVLLLRNLFSKISVLTWWNYLIHSDSINQYRQFVPFESLFLNRLFFFLKKKQDLPLYVWQRRFVDMELDEKGREFWTVILANKFKKLYVYLLFIGPSVKILNNDIILFSWRHHQEMTDPRLYHEGVKKCPWEQK